jgi:hypothetical protein
MLIIPEALAACKQAVPFFDRVLMRVPQPLSRQQLAFLRQHADKANSYPSKHPMWHSRSRCWSKLGYHIVAPDDAALAWIGRLPADDYIVNVIEPALDLVVNDAAAKQDLLELFDTHFVQGWHHQQQVRRWGNGGTTTGNRRKFFAWYIDESSKRTGDEHVLHLEGRLTGARVLRANNIDQHELVSFDHASFWRRHLNLFTVDLDILGRAISNKEHGQRRRHAIIHRLGYNKDLLHGGMLYRHANYKRMHDINHESFSVQHLIDEYGRGRYLHRIDVSGIHRLLAMSYSFVNTDKPFETPQPIASIAKNITITPSLPNTHSN